MESRRKRSRSQRLKWGCYILLLVVCTVLQTMPELFQFGAAKPLWLLPLCLAVSAAEAGIPQGYEIEKSESFTWQVWDEKRQEVARGKKELIIKDASNPKQPIQLELNFL